MGPLVSLKRIVHNLAFFGHTESEAVVEEAVQVRLAKLESHVEHIQVDVADIKVDLRRLDAKIDKVNDSLNDRVNELSEKLSSMAVRAVLLYLAGAISLLGVLAKGFKWL